MINLIAKSQSEGQYYFIDEKDDAGAVYRICTAFPDSLKEYVDPLPVFLRKSIDTDIVCDDKNFQSFEELRDYAINDKLSESHDVGSGYQESFDDILIYAPIVIIDEYLMMIENMLKNHEFIGIDHFLTQLSRNILLRNDVGRQSKLFDLRNMYDESRFPNKEKIIASIQFKSIKNRLRANKHVYANAS